MASLLRTILVPEDGGALFGQGDTLVHEVRRNWREMSCFQFLEITCNLKTVIGRFM